MSNVSIFEKKWLDLVFEGKNQKYGAYQLRKDSSKTTFFAFIFGISFLLGSVLLLSSFNSKPVNPDEDIIIDEVIRVDNYNPPTSEPEKPIAKPKKSSAPVDNIENSQNYVPTETNKANPDIPNNEDIKKNSTTPSNNGEQGGTGTVITIGGGGGIGEGLPKPDNEVKKPNELDRQPDFPGGIKKFYQYVGNNFERQELEEGESVRVLVSFVIEKNGAMTDIQVVQKTKYAIDSEAIRVLKSLKTKWEPGYKDGAPVRTQFTLPITIKM